MADQRNKLQRKYSERDRFANFADCIVRIRIRGFRCHLDTILDIKSPVTAICGLNGTGKSTILHLAACAYKKPDAKISYYLPDFLAVSVLDPRPFISEARCEFQFWSNDRNPKQVTFSRNSDDAKWEGYKRRPRREVFFAGVGIYIPKIEKRDFVFRHAPELDVLTSESVAPHIREWVSRILEIKYDDVVANRVSFKDSKTDVMSVRKGDLSYSESHMGYGEGRTQYLITRLESLPRRSLVLIEEPETSLHPMAEFEMGRYFVDVATRKGHQIFVTTHSEALLAALPAQSRIYLKRFRATVQPRTGLSALEIKSILTNGFNKTLFVLVEDDCAKAVLREILRKTDPDFFRGVEICAGGSKEKIAATVRGLSKTSVPVAAVCDADSSASPRENILVLPGTDPPEKEFFKCSRVRRMIEEKYDLSFDNFEATVMNRDHHEWIPALARRIAEDEAVVRRDAASEYVKSLPENETHSLTAALKEASAGCVSHRGRDR